MDATATPRGTPARVIARDNSTFPRSLRPSTVFVDSVLVKPAPHTATRLAYLRAGAVLEIMFHDGWRWGLALQQCLSRSSGVLYRARVAGVRVEGTFPPFAINMLWNQWT